MFLSLSTISPTNTRLRCVLSFHDQCLKPHRPLYLVLRFQPLNPPFLLEPQSAWGSSLLFCRRQWPGCLDELQVMQIARSELALFHSHRLAEQSTVDDSLRHVLRQCIWLCAPHQSLVEPYALRDTAIAQARSPLSAHTKGSRRRRYPLRTLEASKRIGPSFRLESRGWLVTQMMGRWSDSVAPITSSSNAMFVVGAKRSVTMWSWCFPPFPQPTYVFSTSQKVESTLPPQSSTASTRASIVQSAETTASARRSLCQMAKQTPRCCPFQGKLA